MYIQTKDVSFKCIKKYEKCKKILQKSSEKVWRLCFITLLLHPHSRENGASEMMETWRYPWVGDEVGWAKR